MKTKRNECAPKEKAKFSSSSSSRILQNPLKFYFLPSNCPKLNKARQVLAFPLSHSPYCAGTATEKYIIIINDDSKQTSGKVFGGSLQLKLKATVGGSSRGRRSAATDKSCGKCCSKQQWVGEGHKTYRDGLESCGTLEGAVSSLVATESHCTKRE